MPESIHARDLVIGVDVGGTFTDTVVWAADGSAFVGKSSTTHGNLEEGVEASLASALRTLGHDVETGLRRTSLFVHGTTVGTNSIVERTGAKVGLLCTRGHADALSIMRAHGRVAGLSVEEVLDVARAAKPAPIVPRGLVEEVNERTVRDGTILIPVDRREVEDAARRLVERGCDSIAIAFLWSFVNSDNEILAAEAVRRIAPSAYVTISSDIAPRQGEYERFVATVVNAYVGPQLQVYFARLAARLSDCGFGGQILVMTCGGGLLRVDAASRRALFTIGSGPASGALATERLTSLRGDASAIATDMGGTTFDVSVVVNGTLARRPTTITEQYEYFAETIDVQSIGAGGGSIAAVDQTTGTLRVGPRSAGSIPGPACYGHGGTRATVTDADLLLGFIDSERFLGGSKPLDVAAAEKAMDYIANQLDMSRIEVAAGIVRITDARMTDLIRRMTIERGVDPRSLALYAYGGAAPLHVGAYARSLGCQTAVVPLGVLAPVWSAFGAAAADVAHVRARGVLFREPFDDGGFWTIVDALRSDAEEELELDGFPPDLRDIAVHVEMRYGAQTHALDVKSPERTENWSVKLLESFESLYAARYGAGAGYRVAGIEITTIKVTARGLRTLPAFPRHGAQGPVRSWSRPVYWTDPECFEETSIFEYETLPPGFEVAGPSIIELPTTSIVIHPGQTAVLDPFGNVILDLVPVQVREARPRAASNLAG